MASEEKSMMHVVHEMLMTSTTTTTFDAHRGAVLPAARAVVVAVPLVALFVYWFLIVRPRRR
jgi:hypothetical protein